MKKILIVQYTPRNERSKTKELVDDFISKVDKQDIVEVLDLTKEVPEFFFNENLTNYALRNYMGQELDSVGTKNLEKFDRFTKQFKEADVVVVAYPMYNFTMPGIVKSYFDMVMQKGETWDVTESGYVGLLNDKKALLLSSAGGIYNEEMGNLAYDMSSSLFKTLMGFVGINDIKIISAQGMNMLSSEEVEKVLDNSKLDISDFVENI